MLGIFFGGGQIIPEPKNPVLKKVSKKWLRTQSQIFVLGRVKWAIGSGYAAPLEINPFNEKHIFFVCLFPSLFLPFFLL
jgi:hypothetical protein